MGSEQSRPAEEIIVSNNAASSATALQKTPGEKIEKIELILTIILIVIFLHVRYAYVKKTIAKRVTQDVVRAQL